MTPSQAVRFLLKNNWTEPAIAAEVGSSQATINRIGHGRRGFWDVGDAVIKLALKVQVGLDADAGNTSVQAVSHG